MADVDACNRIIYDNIRMSDYLDEHILDRKVRTR